MKPLRLHFFQWAWLGRASDLCVPSCDIRFGDMASPRDDWLRCVNPRPLPLYVLIGAVIHTQENRHRVPKSVLRAVLGRMQFTL